MFIENIRPVSVEDLGVTRHETELSNGSKLILFQKPNSPLYIRSAFLSGSRFDPPGKDGTSHHMEHMLVAGTERFPSKDRLAAHIEQFGGGLGASTGVEVMSVNTSIPDPEDHEVAFEIMHEMLLSSLFERSTTDIEKSAIIKELSSKKSNPGEMAWEIYRRLFFQGTAVGRSTLGSVETINSITHQDLIDFYNQNINSSRLALVMSGGIAFNQAVELAEKHLLVPEGDRPQMVSELPLIRDIDTLAEPFYGKDQVHLILGFRTVPYSHQDNAALTIISEVLGSGRSSTLSRKLRLERGLVYGVHTWKMDHTDSGTWLVKTSTTKDSVQEVVDVISDEIKRISDSGLTKEELEFAKRKMIKSKRTQLQTSSDWVDWHAYRELKESGQYSLRRYTESILEVTPEQTVNVAQTYFGKEKWYLGMCGDISAKDVVVKL